MKKPRRMGAPTDEAEAAAAHAEEEDERTSDVCQYLLARYGKSSSPQHRHLCASACAMRSILSDEGLPLTPPAYLAAVLTSMRDADFSDAAAISALSSFLSVLLPRVRAASVPKDRMRSTVVPILRSHRSRLPTPALKSLVSALGLLVLALDANEDWASAKIPIQTLLEFALDKRPKVRKSAQSCVEKSISHFRGTALGKEYRKLVISMFKDHVSRNTTSVKPQMLQVVKLVIPTVPKKKVVKLLPEVYPILPLSPSCPPVLSLLDVMLERSRADDLVSKAEELVSSLLSVLSVSRSKLPDAVVITVSSLLKKVLARIHPVSPGVCVGNLQSIFTTLLDFVSSKSNAVAQHVSKILEELISCHIDHTMFQTDAMGSSSEAGMAILTLFSLLEKMICACSGVPSGHVLTLVSALFLKLGAPSSHCIEKIVLELGQRMNNVSISPDLDQLRECIGSAIVTIGPEKMLQLLPISFSEEKMMCSNTWLIPLLGKYVSGSSLEFFMEHIIPLATHLKKKCRKGKRSHVSAEEIQSMVQQLWDLLPAFCHNSVDISENFGSLAKLLVDSLIEDTSLCKPIALALQVIVKENKQALQGKKSPDNINELVAISYNDLSRPEFTKIECRYTVEDATKNMEAVVSSSVDLFEALICAFHNSPLESHQYLKGAIECLSPLVGASYLQIKLDTLLKKFEVKDDGAFGDGIPNIDEAKKITGTEDRRVAEMDLVYCFVKGAKKGLLRKIYDYIEPFLLQKMGCCHREAYLVLHKILSEHSRFTAEKMDVLLNLLIGKNPSDINILKVHLSCLQLLLVYLLHNDNEEKSFLILNEIILMLKDSSKEVREAAYDLLSGLLGRLKDSEVKFSGSTLHRFLAMIMGYFSCTSPQITSGAIAAVSLIVYKDADICIYEPNLLPSIMALLRKKDTGIIKASLGFVKVLVSSLGVIELKKLLPEVVNGILPWSSVSKHHFRTKVKVIFEIMMRRCGANAVNMVVPEKFRGFIKNIQDYRKNKTSSKETGDLDKEKIQADSKLEGDRKRKRKFTHSNKKHSLPETSHEQKAQRKFRLPNARRQKQTSGSDRKRKQSGDNSPMEKKRHLVDMNNGKHGKFDQRRRKTVGREAR